MKLKKIERPNRIIPAKIKPNCLFKLIVELKKLFCLQLALLKHLGKINNEPGKFDQMFEISMASIK